MKRISVLASVLVIVVVISVVATVAEPVVRIAGGVWEATAQLFSRIAHSRSLPNPVESKKGVSYIPIDDTAFLIPEKTWLTGFSRRSTDGSVGSISLHATIPDVQPWSQERHEEMYWRAGPGKKLRIRLDGYPGVEVVEFVPHTKNDFVEEPNNKYAAQGLKKYRRYHNGQPHTSSVYYELVEDNRLKYLIRCSEGSGGLFEGCNLFFPVSKTVKADVEFESDHMKHIVVMADKLSVKLQEFQSAGLAYRAAKARNSGDNP